MIPVELFYIFILIFTLKYVFRVPKIFMILAIVLCILADAYIENFLGFWAKFIVLCIISVVFNVNFTLMTFFLRN